ncbi:uncharacterized protein ACO6RY_06548 [Pungitius sinensis]
MDLKVTEVSLDCLDHVDAKDLKVLLVTPEKKDVKASALVEIQVFRGSPALLDSEAQRVTLLLGPQDPLAFQDDRALRDLKGSPDPPGSTDWKDSPVWQGPPVSRAREDRMGHRVQPALRGSHTTPVMEGSLVPGAF